MVLTIAVTGFLFTLACSCFAVGESVRQKLKLQNAADSAAYSGAVVQADTLSRIAVINKAMAWTYVQMTRRHMDLAVDAWLEKSLIEFSKRTQQMIRGNAPSCLKIPGINWTCGAHNVLSLIELNKSKTEWTPYVVAQRAAALGQQKNYAILETKVIEDIRAINSMNDTIVYLQNMMSGRIEAAVQNTLKDNLTDELNSPSFYRLIQSKPSSYMRVLNNTEMDERRFISFADAIGGRYKNSNTTAKEVFDKGCDKWLQRFPAMTPGIQRVYRQQSNNLRADFGGFYQIWEPTPDGPVLVYHSPFFSWTVWGKDSPVISNNLPPGLMPYTCRPQILKNNFFGKDGAITLYVCQKNRNPFSFLDVSGLFSIFNPVTSHFEAVSVARAAYKKPYNFSDGQYELGWMNEDYMSNRYWNLCETDWDAMLLPTKYGWSRATTGLASSSFAGRNNDLISEAIQSSSDWKSVQSGGNVNLTINSNMTSAEAARDQHH